MGFDTKMVEFWVIHDLDGLGYLPFLLGNLHLYPFVGSFCIFHHISLKYPITIIVCSIISLIFHHISCIFHQYPLFRYLILPNFKNHVTCLRLHRSSGLPSPLPPRRFEIWRRRSRRAMRRAPSGHAKG